MPTIAVVGEVVADAVLPPDSRPAKRAVVPSRESATAVLAGPNSRNPWST